MTSSSSLSSEQLVRLDRRHSDLIDRVDTLKAEASRAADVRQSFWKRHEDIAECLSECRKELKSLGEDVVDSIDSKIKSYQVPRFLCIFLKQK